MEMEARMRAEREAERAAYLGRSAEDGGDVLVYTKPWRRIGFCSTTSIVHYSWTFSVSYSYGYESFSHVWYIFIWSHTCNLFSMQNQSTASNNPRGSPNPSSNQSSWSSRWCSSELSGDLKLMFVKNLWACSLYEICGVDDTCDDFVMYMRYQWYIFCLFRWNSKDK
jgi:hypothetical protein